MSEDLCYSGGAPGADTLFGECAAKAGHRVVHLHFDPKKRNREGFRILTQTELRHARKFLVQANKTLGRSVPTDEESDTYKLLARNYYQVRDTSRIYAVGRLENNRVAGGTAWAVQMFIDSCADPTIHLFDQNGRGWLSYDKAEDQWCSILKPGKPHGRYTGIGSRELTTEGEEALISLYS